VQLRRYVSVREAVVVLGSILDACILEFCRALYYIEANLGLDVDIARNILFPNVRLVARPTVQSLPKRAPSESIHTNLTKYQTTQTENHTNPSQTFHQSKSTMKLNLLLLSTAAVVNAVDVVNLRTAGSYTILSKSGITTVPASAITGDIAVSPIAAAAITGFDLTPITSETAYSTDLTGQMHGGLVYAANHASPTPSNLGIAVSDMETAYSDAAARANTNGVNLLGGNLGGATLTPGVYTFTTDILIAGADLTLDGDGVYIIQTTGNLKLATDTDVISTNAQASNIFWQVAGAVTAGERSEMMGVILSMTAAVFESDSVLNGRILAQTAVTLGSTTVYP
jgi:hypothetical protein